MRDETDLVQGMLRGEQRAFDEFFDAYAARLGAFAARRSSLDAAALEDVVQVTMISAVRGLAILSRCVKPVHLVVPDLPQSSGRCPSKIRAATESAQSRRDHCQEAGRYRGTDRLSRSARGVHRGLSAEQREADNQSTARKLRTNSRAAVWRRSHRAGDRAAAAGFRERRRIEAGACATGFSRKLE